MLSKKADGKMAKHNQNLEINRMKTSGEILEIVLDAAGGAYQAVQPTMSELMDEFFATAEPDHECLNCGMKNCPTDHDCSETA